MTDDMRAHYNSLQTQAMSTFSSAFKDEPLSPVRGARSSSRRGSSPMSWRGSSPMGGPPGMSGLGASAGVRVAPPPPPKPMPPKALAAAPMSHDGAAPLHHDIPLPNKPAAGAPPVRDPNDRSAAEIAGPNHELFDVAPTVVDPGLGGRSMWSVAIDWVTVNFGFGEGDDNLRRASQHAPADKGWGVLRHGEQARSAEMR